MPILGTVSSSYTALPTSTVDYLVVAGGGGGGTGAGGYNAFAGGGGGAGGSAGTANTGGGGGGGGSPATTGATGGSGVVVIAYLNTFPAPTSISGGLTYDQPSRSGYRVYRFTAGTGTVTF